MKRTKIEIVKLEEDKYYIVVETTDGLFSQTICNKADAIETLKSVI